MKTRAGATLGTGTVGLERGIRWPCHGRYQLPFIHPRRQIRMLFNARCNRGLWPTVRYRYHRWLCTTLCASALRLYRTIIFAYDAIPYSLARRDSTAQTSPPARSARSNVFMLFSNALPHLRRTTVPHFLPRRNKNPQITYLLAQDILSALNTADANDKNLIQHIVCEVGWRNVLSAAVLTGLEHALRVEMPIGDARCVW